jgi:hypothetical protein
MASALKRKKAKALEKSVPYYIYYIKSLCRVLLKIEPDPAAPGS